ncbi:Putative HTH-type transcriptional regulator [Thermoflexales bacterium]|nr:Putative HTH-type transcriptional regulator [Thermoflexales bacterium]
MDNPDTFGAWLRQQRNQLKLTREQFAGRVGCSVALLRKIEDGERRPSTQIAELLANCLNIPLAERSAFVKVARGELSVDRLTALPRPSVSPASTAAMPPLRVNLPILPTPLIGRQHEVEDLSQLLRDSQCRLLTLVGPGGIGKTRLALETASHLPAAFADGVYFVPLASVHTTRFIVPVIADALGFTFQSASPADPKTQLFSYLKEKQALLLLDNLEHLLTEPGIELLAELLANAPQVKLLATSRESLGLQGEWVFEVQGLPIPASGYSQESAQNTSVELFLQRARRAHVGFTATLEDYSAIVRICQLVEGMPLGIELAAAWVRTLACDEIAHEIEHGLSFLSASTRDLPARHRSMRAVFDHSWRLLAEQEQAILLRLSVFQGGFQREAAEAVAEATLTVLSTLVTKSLIRRSGAGRYDLHELIRQFAAEYFAERPAEQATTQARHGHYYLEFFSQADGRLRSSAQRETLAELTAELENFRAAWEWAITQGEFALIEQTLRTFAMLYDTRGWFQAGLAELEPAVVALEALYRQPTPGRTEQMALGHLLVCQALLAFRLARHTEARVMLERSLELLHPLNEPHVLVEAITFLGFVMEVTGNYARAVELYSEGQKIAAAIGDRWFAALCFICLADQVGIVQGVVKPENLYQQLQSAVADWRAIGDLRLIAAGLNLLSWNAMALGRYAEARAALEESISLSISISDRWVLGNAYRGLGIVAQVQGEHVQALEMFYESLNIFTELGTRQDVARELAELGRSVFALGDDAEAGRIWHESLRLTTETQGVFTALEALVGLASLQMRQGASEKALEVLLIVLNHPASIQETKKRAARLRTDVEARLTRPQIEAAQARAQAKTFEVAVDEVLKRVEFTH